MAESTTFGDYIRELRDGLGFGLREASRKLGFSASYLSRLEAGSAPPPSGPKLRRIAEVFGANIECMMKLLAQSRAHEMMAADEDVAPAVQAFYRLAQDKTPEMQERMLTGALDALDLPEEQKQVLLDKLKAALSRSHGQDLPRRAKGDDGLFAFDVKPRILSKQQIEAFATRVLKFVFDSSLQLPVNIETIIRKLAPEVLLIIDDDIEGGYLRDGSPAVLGLSRWSHSGEQREIVIHEDIFDTVQTSVRRRCSFTMAHELYHCLEHLPLVQDRTSDTALKRSAAFVSLSPRLTAMPWYQKKRGHKKLTTAEDWREWQANTFAGAILMPEADVRREFELLRDEYEADEDIDPKEAADTMARAGYIDADGQRTSLIDRFDVNPQAMAIRLLSLSLIET